ncbi:MAG: hypothetical protein ACPL1F_02400 [bacterium]|jgi:hypothetical protein
MGREIVNLDRALNSTKINGNLNLRDEGINFPKNQILNAKVLQKENNNQVLLRIGNHSVKANIPNNIYLRPGDSFRLQVIGKEGDLWNFKFVSINRSSVFYKLSPDVINAHLINLKLPINDNSQEIVKAIFKYNLELNKENYRILSAFANLESKLFLESAAFLRAFNLPVNNITVKIMYEFLNNNSVFTNLILGTLSLINSSNLPSGLYNAIYSILQSFGNNILKELDNEKGKKISDLNEIILKKNKDLANRIFSLVDNLKDNKYPLLRNNLEKIGFILKGIDLINSNFEQTKILFNIIPVIINGYPTTAELKVIYYSDKNNLIDKSRYSFEVNVLNTLVSGSVLDNIVSIHIKKSIFDEKIFIQNQKLLEELLNKVGFKLGNYLVDYIIDPNIDEGVNIIS